MRKIKLTHVVAQAQKIFFAVPQVEAVWVEASFRAERGDPLLRPVYQVVFFYKDPLDQTLHNSYGDGDTPESAIYHTKIKLNKIFPGVFDVQQEVEI